MSAVSNDKPTGFFAKHEVNFYTGAAVVSLALGLISLGVIVAAMGTSSHYWYNDVVDGADGWRTFHHDPTLEIPEQIKNASEIKDSLYYGSHVGEVAIAPCVVGFVLFAIALVARHRALKKQLEQKNEAEKAPDPKSLSLDASTQRWKYIGILLGFSIATFATGLMIGSSMILNNTVSHVEDLIHQGRIDYRDAHTYEWVYEYGRKCWHWTHENFWDKLQSTWVDPTKSTMSGMIPVGLFGALGGSGLIAVSILGRGVFSCFKGKYTIKEEERGDV